MSGKLWELEVTREPKTDTMSGRCQTDSRRLPNIITKDSASGLKECVYVCVCVRVDCPRSVSIDSGWGWLGLAWAAYLAVLKDTDARVRRAEVNSDGRHDDTVFDSVEKKRDSVCIRCCVRCVKCSG